MFLALEFSQKKPLCILSQLLIPYHQSKGYYLQFDEHEADLLNAVSRFLEK